LSGSIPILANFGFNVNIFVMQICIMKGHGGSDDEKVSQFLSECIPVFLYVFWLYSRILLLL
jgi:hypothetical protein